MKPFSLLIKPASADCNLRCRYCFYLDHAAMFPETRRHRMPDEVLEGMIRGYMATEQPVYAFGWQGGEPTLMGTSFFERVVELQQRYGRPGAAVSNGLQTNATLISDELAAHLAAYRFLTGVSLDGPSGVHDRYRRTPAGEGSHAAVLAGISRLRRARAEFNVLTLVSQANIDRPADIYDYLVDQGIFFHQYIECVEFDAVGQLRPYSIDGAAWGKFLCEIFDRWYPRDTHRVSVRLFDSILTKLVDGTAACCSMNHDCRDYLVVEYNGDVFPCDFYVHPDYRMGNVRHDDWTAMRTAPAYAEFGKRKRRRHPFCTACAYVDLCAGDCPKNRVGLSERDPASLSVLCSGWRMFYAHTMGRFEELAEDIRRTRAREARVAMRRAASQTGRGDPHPGRNDPCPCGSGQKFKKCCGLSMRAR